MRLDLAIRDEGLTLREILRALDHNLMARDNFAPEGVAGQVLTSNGPGAIPSYQDLPALPDSEEDDGEIEASRIVGTLTEARLQGQYRGITSVAEAAVTEHQAALSIGWSQLTSVPTTIAGYGITDAYTKTEVDALITALSLDDLDDVVITAPAVKHVLRYDGAEWVNVQLAFSDLSGSIANGQVPASAVTQHQAALSVGWSQLTSVPTTLAGFGITDAYTKTATDTLLAAKADTATTLGGYGITDAYTKSAVDALFAALTTGDLTDWPANAAGALTNDGSGSLSWAAASGAVSSVFGRTGAVVAVADDYAADDIDLGTWQTGEYVIPDGGQFTGTASTTNWHPFYIKANVTGNAWVGALPFYDGAGTRYGFVGKDVSGQDRIALVADVGELHLNGASGIVADTSIYLTGGSTLFGNGIAMIVNDSSYNQIFRGDGAYTAIHLGSGGDSNYHSAPNHVFRTAAGVSHTILTAGVVYPATSLGSTLGDATHLWSSIYSGKYLADSLTCGSAAIGAGVAEITVNTTAVTADSRIFVTPIGLLVSADNIFFVSAITAGASFKIKRFGTTTNSGVIHWFIVDEL